MLLSTGHNEKLRPPASEMGERRSSRRSRDPAAPGLIASRLPMAEESFRVLVPGKGSVSAIRRQPGQQSVGTLLIYAPGAGTGLRDPFGALLCRELNERGLASIRFQFPYKEAGRSAPDAPAVLEATWRAVVEAVRAPGVRVVIGGRSMGGRIASQVVAQGLAVDALLLFAYPLHPPGQPERLRDAHLPAIAAPTLFCSGTRDAFGTPEELRAAAAKVPRALVHLLEGADHGFAGSKGSGRTRRDIWTEAVEATASFLVSF